MSRQYQHQYRYLSSRKHKTPALLFCIFGGHLGLHYFYVRRYWRGAFNLLLLLLLTISSRVFGTRYKQIFFGPVNSIFVHWREAVAVICALILGVTWILDIVHIIQGSFRDSEKLPLK